MPDDGFWSGFWSGFRFGFWKCASISLMGVGFVLQSPYPFVTGIVLGTWLTLDEVVDALKEIAARP